MPRPLSFRDELARAGARSLDGIADEVVSERRYQDQMARQDSREARDEARYADQLARQAAMDQRAERTFGLAEKREERMLENQELENKVQNWHFEKEKKMDANATALRDELDAAAITANEELRQIKTDAKDSRKQLLEWRVRNFRALKDPRIIEQYKLNEDLVSRKEQADADLAAYNAKSSGTVTIDEDGKATIRRPVTPELEAKLEAEKERARLEKRHSGLEVLVSGGKGTKTDIDNINKIKAELGYDLMKGGNIPVEQIKRPAPATQSVDGGIYDRARKAIESGAPKDAVIERLKQSGGDPSKL